MKCQNCGQELPSGSAFCSSCGTKLETPPAVNEKSLLRSIFSSPNFLAICIILTVSAIFSAREIFSVLFAVGCWIIYSNAKSSSDPIRSTGYKFLYTVAKVQYIIVWVSAAIVAVSGVVAALIVMCSRPLAASLLGSAVEYSADISGVLSDVVAFLTKMLTSISATVLIAVFVLFSMVACGAAIGIFNGLVTRHIVKYLGGLVKAAENGDSELDALDHSGVSVRLIICGVISVLPEIFGMFRLSLGNGGLNLKWSMGGISSLILAAVYFIGYAMIREYTKNKNKAQ